MKIILVFSIFLLPHADDLYASDSMRCGTELIDIGANQEEVADKCGQPDYIQSLFDPNAEAENTESLDIQEIYKPHIKWIYRGGENIFRRIVIFEGGIISNIEVGKYN